ncbi:hypothetical protein HYH02_007216 [Chlamydomonas schloesseri]|uniref:Uncharacterized protein n=1 Tax=Chlamydomonas schloesseri TaxID=2026947 RepID=A0A836B577_9CHLO|nr:hypothetical protein HYH02_007216 [Chlamydomonas schloesseri]|eukprot:KAG2447758.1 hypothetical protein HYH02_007216 [Chlamydomonas schloesseri]
MADPNLLLPHPAVHLGGGAPLPSAAAEADRPPGYDASYVRLWLNHEMEGRQPGDLQRLLQAAEQARPVGGGGRGMRLKPHQVAWVRSAVQEHMAG